jgi:hypothetical protein
MKNNASQYFISDDVNIGTCHNRVKSIGHLLCTRSDISLSYLSEIVSLYA